MNEKPPFINQIKIPGLTERQLEMFSALGIKEVGRNDGSHLTMLIQGQEIAFENLIYS